MRIIYACFVGLILAAPVFAQDNPPSADQIVSKMQAKLNLTQDQVAAVTPIIAKYLQKRQDLRQDMQDGTLDADSMHTQMKQMSEDEKQELSQILSADQLSQWASMMKNGRHHQNDSPPSQGQ